MGLLKQLCIYCNGLSPKWSAVLNRLQDWSHASSCPESGQHGVISIKCMGAHIFFTYAETPGPDEIFPCWPGGQLSIGSGQSKVNIHWGQHDHKSLPLVALASCSLSFQQVLWFSTQPFFFVSQTELHLLIWGFCIPVFYLERSWTF